MPLSASTTRAKWGLEGFSEALAAEVAPFGLRVTLAELGGVDTAWSAASLAFAAPRPAYDDLRRALFGTAEVPWPTAEGEGPDPRDAAAALLAHVNAEAGPLRLIIGDDAPEHIALALDTRRQDYVRDPRFTWPS